MAPRDADGLLRVLPMGWTQESETMLWDACRPETTNNPKQIRAVCVHCSRRLQGRKCVDHGGRWP